MGQWLGKILVRYLCSKIPFTVKIIDAYEKAGKRELLGLPARGPVQAFHAGEWQGS